MLLEITIGAGLAVVAYSSLAVVLLVAAMASSNVVPLDVALGLVLGANLGSGLLAVLTTAKSTVAVRQVTVGNLVFKLLGVAHRGALRRPVAARGQALHVGRHAAGGALPPGLQRDGERRLHRPHELGGQAGHAAAAGAEEPAATRRPQHLDPSALSTPTLAISNAAREALHQADVVETMLIGMLNVIRNNDLRWRRNCASSTTRSTSCIRPSSTT